MLIRSPRREGAQPLNLTSLMDLFTILLVFLLMSLDTASVAGGATATLTLPTSSAGGELDAAVVVTLTRESVLVDGEPVLQLWAVPDPLDPSRTVPAVAEADREEGLLPVLYDTLADKAETARRLGELSDLERHAFSGRLLLQCDRSAPYALVREVLATASRAGYADFQFLVYHQP